MNMGENPTQLFQSHILLLRLSLTKADNRILCRVPRRMMELHNAQLNSPECRSIICH